MMGVPSPGGEGIIPRMCQDIYTRIADLAAKKVESIVEARCAPALLHLLPSSPTRPHTRTAPASAQLH